jgi:acyl-CoA dehydrogenase
MIDFSLTEEQKALQAKARRFAQEEIIPVAAKYDMTAELPIEIFMKAKEWGLINLIIPKELGGQGLSLLDHCIISEELNMGCAAIAGTVTVNSLATIPILTAGNEAQKKEFILDLCRSSEPKFASFAVTEEEAGSDVTMINATAKRVGNEYILNGTKKFIGNGAYASFYTVVAYTDKSKKHKGITAFLVPKGEGVVITKIWDKMGHRGINTADVKFEEVRIPIRNRLGEEGEGFKIAAGTLNATRPVVAASAVGVARRAMEEATRYALKRTQFGSPIAANQAVSFAIADMGKDIEAARLLTWHAAWMADRYEVLSGRLREKVSELSLICSYAKTFATDMAVRATDTAIQIFGARGYMKDFPLEKLMRDVKMLQIVEGTNQIQRRIAAQEIFRNIERG